jgi:hypothetical protein
MPHHYNRLVVSSTLAIRRRSQRPGNCLFAAAVDDLIAESTPVSACLRGKNVFAAVHDESRCAATGHRVRRNPFPHYGARRIRSASGERGSGDTAAR